MLELKLRYFCPDSSSKIRWVFCCHPAAHTSSNHIMLDDVELNAEDAVLLRSIVSDLSRATFSVIVQACLVQS